jgi:hypothetical protein
MTSIFSRRAFLKYFGLSFAGLIIPTGVINRMENYPFVSEIGKLLGRVTQWGVKLYQQPDSTSETLGELNLDDVHRITGVRINEENGPNSIWFELDGNGYAYSRYIQPVKENLNDPVDLIPEDGCLGEITVPFVDAYSSMKDSRKVIYRFYYSATFWILKSVIDQDQRIWYELLDDKFYSVFYIPAEKMRLVPRSELTPISAWVPPEDKKLVVDLGSQILTAYEQEKVVFKSKISSGVRLIEGGFATPRGQYRIIRKRPCRHMANPANAYGSGFDLPGVPWVSYFTSDGVAFHGTYWHNDFGVPHSHGCINMTSQTAKWVYRWTTPAVPPENYYFSDTNGTRVIIQ